MVPKMYPSKINAKSLSELSIVGLRDIYKDVVRQKELCEQIDFSRGDYVDEVYYRVLGDISDAIYYLERICEELKE